MKSSSIILALAAGSSAAIVARDTATILADIAAIDSDVKSLTTAVNAYEVPLDATALISAESGLEAAINKGTSDTKATSGPLSIADANSLLSAVAALIPDIVAALDAVITKQPTFGAIYSVVTTDLTQLQGETDAFANALIAIAPAAAGDSANAAKACIDAAFASALATKSADGSCAASVTTIAGGAPTSSSVAPTSTAPGSSSVAPTSTAPGSSSVAPTSTAPGSSSVAPTSSTTTKPSGSGYPSGTGVGPTPSSTIPFTGGAGAVKVGGFGAAVMAVLALVI